MSSDSDDESYIIGAERKAKQNFLKEEIIENNYDPQLFMMFCSQKKEPDVDYWEFDELQTCVHDFKMTYRRGQTLKEVQEAEEKKNRKKNPKKSEPKIPEKILENPPEKIFENAHIESKVVSISQEEIPLKPEPAEIKIISPNVKKRKIVLPTEGTFFDIQPLKDEKSSDVYIGEYTIVCNKLPGTELSSARSLEFTLNTPEHIETGFFSSNYYLYPVVTSPLAWTCRRKYSDFIWLQSILTAIFPGIYIPPIPPHKSLTGPEQDTTFKRKAILTKFTTALTRNKLILSLPLIENFFKIPTHEEFEEYKKSTQKNYQRPDDVKGLFSVNGEIKCNLLPEDIKAQKFFDYANGADPLEKRLKRQASVVIKDLNLIAERGKNIAGILQELSKVQTDFFGKTGNTEVFSNLSSGFNSFSEIDTERQKAFKEHFNMYFKYSYLEKEQILGLLKERESAFKAYEKAEVNKKHLEKHRNMFGYFNKNALQEIQRALDEENLMLIKNFSSFARKNADLTSSLHSASCKLSSELTT